MRVVKAVELLTKSFMALPRKDLQRLQYHVDAKTTILCGESANRFVDGEGGG